MNPDEMVFSAWLQNVLKEKNITAAELADKVVGVSRASVFFYANGKRIPGPDAVAKLCAALGVEAVTVPAFARRKEGRRQK